MNETAQSVSWDNVYVIPDHRPLCRNCRFYGSAMRWDREDKRFCENPQMRVRWAEGYGANEVGDIGDNTLCFNENFGCTLFEAKD